uniref:Uncharacterized protein n=1 Tax=Oryza meridionalis TaxID=40149 RepID=A0A0E0CXM5_9ORYZ
MAFSASIFSCCSFAVAVATVLLASTAAARPATSAVVARGTNATAPAANATVTARRGGHGRSSPLSTATTDEEEQYICYLCRGRNTLMISWCPLDKDECHIACLSSPSSASRSSSSSPPRALPFSAAADDGGDNGRGGGHDDCYVMKVYPDGSWVVVDVVSCQASAGCYLVCSYGDALPSSSSSGAAAGEITPAAIGSPLPPGLAEFERCGDQR